MSKLVLRAAIASAILGAGITVAIVVERGAARSVAARESTLPAECVRLIARERTLSAPRADAIEATWRSLVAHAKSPRVREDLEAHCARAARGD
jgi:hypothetical protein